MAGNIDLRRFIRDVAYDLTVNTAYHLFKNDSWKKSDYKGVGKTDQFKRGGKKLKTRAERNLESVVLPASDKQDP